ncbi:uncharacterized protein LY89DRAFT_689860 [Mollisia scopiformis]|uniref:Uncharacterized protein n=1 Tax=Mollisia scopiformis TaxID=149040 RepID=A0A132BDB9_MOLSC|nr:uncharacterized protein LY89DRAFT_689860 [Mollisia scopiformis]KUJ09979.1 hypothetical protein LY89DRAFT_689860 [Mollisia scopiformis]
MAEAFAALNIAANIAQFVDYAKQLISSSKEIYSSLDGARDEYKALKVIIEDIKTANDELHPRSSPSPSTDEVRFRKLAAECEPLADKLLAILKDLEVASDARFRRLQTMRQTIRGAAKKKDVQDLQRRLVAIDVKLHEAATILLQKKHYNGITSAINTLTQTNERLKMNTNLALEEMRLDLVRTLERQEHRVKKEQQTRIENLFEELRKLANAGQEMTQQQAILRTLLFEEMEQRQETIQDAHKATLDWMFKPDKEKFVEWLEAERGIYWVRGKAGSGKSTLMKYICNHETTLKTLRRWAGTKQLFTASFFFWNSGYPMQKSQIGLLRSLLYQVLRACPALIMEVCPSKLLMEPWKRTELFEVLEKVSKQATLPAKFCFFVDGLDEYEGDDEDIIALLQDLASSPSVKICVSSRPWNAFLDAFDDSGWKLVLEDLTRNDMCEYVQTMLAQNEIYRKMSMEDPRCKTLIPQIAQKAQGVWLWVYLVVRDLLRDLKGGEEFPLLQRRLDSFPNELEKYFENIISRIDKIHREETARIFLVAVTVIQPLPIFYLHCLAAEIIDKDYAIHMDIEQTSAGDVIRTKKKWKKLLNSRCRDLLEADGLCDRDDLPCLDGKVNFLHRTVSDFLRSNYLEELRSRAGEEFDARSSLCKIIIALSKVSADMIGQRNSGNYSENIPAFDLVDEMLLYAKDYERTEALSMTVLLDELDRVNTIRAGGAGNHGHWTNNRKAGIPEYDRCTFLALTVQMGLRRYVREKLESNKMLIAHKRGRPLLDYACRPVMDSRLLSQLGKDNVLDPRMVCLLLEYGSDPNQRVEIYSEGTIWRLFIIGCDAQKRGPVRSSTQIDMWYEIIELMIDHGANPDANVQTVKDHDGYDDQKRVVMMTIQPMLESIFGTDRAARLASRMKEVAQRNRPPPSLLRRLLGWT